MITKELKKITDRYKENEKKEVCGQKKRLEQMRKRQQWRSVRNAESDKVMEASTKVSETHSTAWGTINQISRRIEMRLS